ncbi:MAG: peroxiredoxin [Promicromonosporaceae bacterium]|nr:peroxiredoxin [Promicromonosporaceae bacterium]
MAQLMVGQTAPAFTLPAVGPAQTVSLAGLLESAREGVIVYFYPAALTPGCTTEACDFRDSLASLTAKGYAVVGVSPDKPEKLQRFATQEALTFPLASDPDHAVADAYGAWGIRKLYGKEHVGLLRSTVVIGLDGKVVLARYNVKATGHVARLRVLLGIDAPN